MRRDVYGDLEIRLPASAFRAQGGCGAAAAAGAPSQVGGSCVRRPRVRQRAAAMYELVKGTPNQVYVADGTRGGRHNYGVAVDVTLLDETGAPVDMGTPVDFFGDEAHTGNEPALGGRGTHFGRSLPQPPAARKRDARSGAGALSPRVVALRGADGDVRSPDPV